MTTASLSDAQDAFEHPPQELPSGLAGLAPGPRMAPRPEPWSRSGLAGLVAAWVLSLVLLVGLAAAVIQWRMPITKAWPPAARAYSLIGRG